MIRSSSWLSGGSRMSVEVILQQREQVVALDRALAGQQFVEDQAGGKDVGTLADFLPQHVFRRHVRWCAHQALAVASFRRRLLDPRGDAEIHHARKTVLVDQDVGRLQVAVDHASACACAIASSTGCITEMARTGDRAPLSRRYSPRFLPGTNSKTR